MGLNLFLFPTLTCTENPQRQGQNFVYERDLCIVSLKITSFYHKQLQMLTI